MGTNLPTGKPSSISRLSLLSTSAGGQWDSANDRNMPRVADISKPAAVPFPDTSASTNPHRPRSSGMKSYQSPPTAPAGVENPEIAKPGTYGELLGNNACWIERAS